MSGNFVLTTDEVWRLQGGTDARTYREVGGNDPECICFQDMAAKGHYGPGAGTKQGIYVCTPGGEFLASINSASPDAVNKMLERGLDAWNKLPDSTRQSKPRVAEPDHRWEWSYPDDGLVLKETIRYLADGALENEDRINFDFAWFSAEEAKSFLPPSPEVGEQHQLPQALYLRLARHHLLNIAQGESGTYHAKELTGGLVVDVLAVDKHKLRIRISGESRAIAQSEHDAHWRARRIDAQLLGFAEFDRAKQKFAEFDLVATGKIFKKADSDPKDAKSIGWFLSLADPNSPADKLSPTHLYGYDAKWVKKPNFALHGLMPNRSDDEKMKVDK